MKNYTGAVLLDENQRIYLIKENDVNNISLNRWNLPGGSVEPDESLINSVVRETKEETGYTAKATSLLGCYKSKKEGKNWLYIVFELHITGKQSDKVDSDITKGKWFTKEGFIKTSDKEIVHPDMKLVYKIATEGKGLSLDSVKLIDYNKKS